MNLWQKIYNWFKSWRYPIWLRPYIQIANDAIIAILKKAGKSYINYLKSKVIEALENKNLTAKQKFEYVFDEAKKAYKEFYIELKDEELKLIVNYLINLLKG